MTRRLLVWALAAAALAGAAFLVHHFASGNRYRLYTNTLAGDCWRVVEIAARPLARLEPVSVGGPMRRPDGGASVSIDYQLDRAFGGAALNVTCAFTADGSLEAVEFQGEPLDDAALADVARALGR